ncbi:GNAT family N-acetyltransferase [Weissella minor]|uniref:GNAT family N-acetyltransferase n=1 Tax=Weissella minor TaxID=1620 RepID=UPI003AF26EC4
MQIEQFTQLTQSQIEDIHLLSQVVHTYDHTHKDAYLSNQYNHFPEMPTFVLGYENESLIGFAMLYADGDIDEIVEISLMVHPSARRKGIGTAIKQRAFEILTEFGYHKVQYLTERAFLVANPDFLMKNQLVVDAEFEYQMRFEKEPVSVESKMGIGIRRMQQADVVQLVPPYMNAFPDSTAHAAEQYLQESLDDTSIETYVLLYEDQPIGYCAVDNGGYYYIFGLFVDADYRNRGFGAQFMQLIMRELYLQEAKPFVIGVEGDNNQAHHLYQKLGFEDETVLEYLTEGE